MKTRKNKGLTIQKIKQLYEKIHLDDKFDKQTKSKVLEIIIQIFLIKMKVREIAQVDFINKKIVKDIIKFLDKYYPYYKLYDERLLLFSNNYTKEINETFGEKHGKDLGEFYKCAKDYKRVFKDSSLRDKENNISFRVIIECTPHLAKEFIDHKTNEKMIGFISSNKFELFSQHCFEESFLENISFFLKYMNKIKDILKRLNKEIEVEFKIQT